MPEKNNLLETVFSLLLAVGVVGFFAWRAFQRSTDRWELLARWFASLVCLALLWFVGIPAALKAPLFGVPLLAAIGIIIGVIWTPSWAEWLSRPITNLFEGGPAEGQALPLYSIAEAERKAGRYQSALSQAETELLKSPHDFQGQMLIAEIYAEDLHDFPRAASGIQAILAQSNHTSGQIAYAVNRLTDWALKLEHNVAEAKSWLELLAARYPGSQEAFLAAQRIAHLGDHTVAREAVRQQRFALQTYPENIGLRSSPAIKPLPEEDPSQVAERYVQQLVRHPDNNEAREQLAQLYAERFDRLDLAMDQLGQLIQQPGVPPSRIARWLHLQADLQIKHGAPLEAAQATLQSIVDRFPKSALAETAQRRIAFLRLEFKGQKKSQAIPLGSAENQNNPAA